MIRWRFVVMVTLAAGFTTAFSRVLLADAPTIGTDWKVDLRTVGAVVGVVVIGTWRLGRWMRKIDDRLDAGEKRFDFIDEAMAGRDRTLAAMKEKIDSLPCPACPDGKSKPKRS